VDASAFLEQIAGALLRLEPTPIWDDLYAEHGPALVAARNDVVEAYAMGGPA
jgi:hypothetical protein